MFLGYVQLGCMKKSIGLSTGKSFPQDQPQSIGSQRRLRIRLDVLDLGRDGITSQRQGPVPKPHTHYLSSIAYVERERDMYIYMVYYIYNYIIYMYILYIFIIYIYV
jgi:hypothetical protein